MEKLADKIAQLPPEKQQEVKDFIEFLLKQKRGKKMAQKQEQVSDDSDETETEYVDDFDWEEEEGEELDTLSLVEPNFQDW